MGVTLKLAALLEQTKKAALIKIGHGYRFNQGNCCQHSQAARKWQQNKMLFGGGKGKRKERPMEPVKLPVPFGGSRYEISMVSAGEPLGVVFLDFLGFLYYWVFDMTRLQRSVGR